MRTIPLLTASFLTLAAGAPALAAPATSQGARAIEQGYAAYLSNAVVDKGIVSVAPDGDSYVVTWNLQKAVQLTDPPANSVKIDKFVYRLTPGANGVWTLKGDAFPNFAFKGGDKALSDAALSMKGFHVDGVYDPQAPEMVKGALVADRMDGAFQMDQNGAASSVVFAQEGLALNLVVKAGADGAGYDVVQTQTLKGLTETVGPAKSEGGGGGAVGGVKGEDPKPAAAAPDGLNLTYKMSGVSGTSTILGLRAAELADLWKYLVAHLADAAPPPDFKTKLKVALPLWKDLTANADVSDLGVETPLGTGGAKAFGETLHISGLTDKGVARIALKVDSLAIDSPLAPPWAASLSNLSLDFDLGVSGDGWGKIANIVLDDPKFGDKDLSPETNAAVVKTFLGGAPKLTLAPGRLTTPVIDLTFEGSAALTGGAPKGTLRITADGLDKTLALLGDIAQYQPDARGAMLGVTFVKGLAKTDGGRLVWDVEIDGEGAVKVNGQLMPTGK